MGKKRKSLTDDLHTHPAVSAWRRLGSSNSIPREVVVLKRKENGAVYGLIGDDLPGRCVIAKLCSLEKGLLERTVYEQVLPQLSSGAIRFFGHVPQDHASMWLFIEDVGGQRYDTDSETHRELAARWFGELQISLSRASIADVFPERGAPFYRRFLNSIMATVPSLLPKISPPREDPAPLVRIVSACERLAVDWDRLERFCAGVPAVFSHGDCLRKNVHVRKTSAGPAIAAFDWGGAGWSPAGTDLGQLALPRRGPPDSVPDLCKFHDVVRGTWPELDLAAIARLAHIGQLFWALKVISRGLPEFDCDWKSPRDILADMHIYERALSRSVDAAVGTSAAPA